MIKFLVLLLFIWPSLLLGQGQIKFDQLGTKEGLSNSSVLSIAQDSSGFIWIGTRYGLNRYDTRSFRIFKQTELDNSLSSSDYLNSMLVDHKGVLWVGTSYGLNRYDDEKEVFQRYNSTSEKRFRLSNDVICSLTEDKDGKLWVGTRGGLNIIQYDDQPILAWSKNIFYALEKAKDGGVWASTNDGIKKISFQHNKLEIDLLSHLNKRLFADDRPFVVATILEDGGGNLWIGTDKKGVFMYNPNNNELRNYRAGTGERYGDHWKSTSKFGRLL
ncbi:hypothetical protein H8S90_00645 [Olivibacter sp. SDN3]|uniref:ligand-binding sensor domain-containing protein n=1 Tax=Olivibacter sp. SDN3 TaxID=2764720 RepID=UPI0016513292|nr:two-component regulator propeller domain-containing protein [Olivibacter sp. SDN3]QNL50179.1 hypothetical protein H8S90_00645 [Olivibacter sp. SDN3]